jgi:hypothetical protein
VVGIVVLGILAGALAYRAGALRFVGLGGGSSDGGGTSPGITGRVIVSNGTTWQIGPHQYEGSWFEIGFTSEILGTFRASGLVTGYILTGSDLVAYTGANSTYGPIPASGAPSVNNWSSGPSMGGYINTFLDPGAYEILFLNWNSSSTSTVQMNSDLIASTESVG